MVWNYEEIHAITRKFLLLISSSVSSSEKQVQAQSFLSLTFKVAMFRKYIFVRCSLIFRISLKYFIGINCVYIFAHLKLAKDNYSWTSCVVLYCEPPPPSMKLTLPSWEVYPPRSFTQVRQQGELNWVSQLQASGQQFPSPEKPRPESILIRQD